MANTKDWVEWHQPYEDADSALSHRLRTVQQQLRDALADRSGLSTRIVSICAGQGDDVIGVLAAHSGQSDITADLIELDIRNVEIARRRVGELGLREVSVINRDAGDMATYTGVSPADVLMVCGVFGNIRVADMARTVATLPQLCRSGATVIWTRHTRPPDITPSIRRWFIDHGFDDDRFIAPDEYTWSVGVNTFRARPQPRTDTGRMFTFVS